MFASLFSKSGKAKIDIEATDYFDETPVKQESYFGATARVKFFEKFQLISRQSQAHSYGEVAMKQAMHDISSPVITDTGSIAKYMFF